MRIKSKKSKSAKRRRPRRYAADPARKVSIIVRADDQDGLVIAFDRKVLGSVFGSEAASSVGAGFSELAEGLRVAIMAAPQLAGGLQGAFVQRGAQASAVDMSELHAENIARSHEMFRSAGIKYCPHCGTNLEPS